MTENDKQTEKLKYTNKIQHNSTNQISNGKN